MSLTDEDLLDTARALLPDVIDLRRRLHQHPELGLDLPRTQAAVLDALEGLDLEISVGERLSSVVADLKGARPGPTVLLRGDMDALPMPEDTGLDFASTVDEHHARVRPRRPHRDARRRRPAAERPTRRAGGQRPLHVPAR